MLAKRFKYVLMLSVIAMMFSSAFMIPDPPAEVTEDVVVEVNWMSFEEAVAKSKVEKRKIFIDVYTDWCGWCKVMDARTFSKPEIARVLNEQYYAVKLDAEQKGDIRFRDYTYKYVASGRRGYHELAAALLSGELSYPTVVFLDEQFNLIQAVKGYHKPEQFHPILTFFADDHFKNTSWADYQKQYKSPF